MPRRLLERFQPDSIREFRHSANARFEDGLALAAAGRRTGAIYMWGYTAEMTLKAAHFSLTGLLPMTPITKMHLKLAIQRGTTLGVAWPTKSYHDVRGWAELLVAERASTPGKAYQPGFAREVQSCGQQIRELWNETIRYHKNVAYVFEVQQVREASAWLLVNSLDL
jgi:hypothetical protein